MKKQSSAVVPTFTWVRSPRGQGSFHVGPGLRASLGSAPVSYDPDRNKMIDDSLFPIKKTKIKMPSKM